MDSVNEEIKRNFLNKLLEDIEFHCYPEVQKKKPDEKVYKTRCFLSFTPKEYVLLKAILDDLQEGR